MSENKRVLGSDFEKIDAYVLTGEDYAEIPEITDEMFARGVLHIGGVPVKRGRPKLREPKRVVNLRLSKRVVDTFRAGGPGWQTRINAALESWLGDHPDGTLA
jgi:uncharacterized protein (DUF4415 family)